MSRYWCLVTPMLALIAVGCSRPATSVLLPGDIVRPEISIAPSAPWPAGAAFSIGLLVRVERPGGEAHDLMDEDVPAEKATMMVKVTFLEGDRMIGVPLEVPLVRDC